MFCRKLPRKLEVETPLEIDLRQVNQPLLDRGHKECTPHILKLILYGLSRDGKGLGRAKWQPFT